MSEFNIPELYIKLSTAVYDPSNRTSNEYWQWSNVQIDENWRDAAGLVHRGWPKISGDFSDQEAILFGVVDNEKMGQWLYRIYPGGRDKNNRPGRYFFVLFQLEAPDQLLRPEVAGVFDYFVNERSLPLNTLPLENALPTAVAGTVLRDLHRHWLGNRKAGHWGMNGESKVTKFSEPPPLLSLPPQVEVNTGGADFNSGEPSPPSSWRGRIPVFPKSWNSKLLGSCVFVILCGMFLVTSLFMKACKLVNERFRPPKSPSVQTNQGPGNPETIDPIENERIDSQQQTEKKIPEQRGKNGKAED
ncbi:MAG: hypothetical protein P1V20_03340 [Verrucomicrobiales bacterium]|nr:hypothetical protein [Verrucomicrobiales bacterium]